MARFDADQILKRVLEQKRQRVEQRLAALRCPDHGTPLEYRFTGGGEKLSWEVSGCCEKLRDAGRAALREPA